MERLQFQVLYRQFLFRMVDLELLSADARGDSSKLFGQFASLLIFLSIGLSAPALALGSRMTPQVRLHLMWALEHFLIATTMLVVGLFAVLSWDSTYPDRKDVMVLAPLPVRLRTLFVAKVAGVAAALGLTVVMLHSLAGLVWPLTLGFGMPAQTIPALSADPAMPPLDAASFQPVLDRDIAPALRPGGPLAPGTGIGAVIGIWKHGQRRVFAYGAARPNSEFHIASLSKTFTALILARMISEGRVRLDEPVRDLLPPETVDQPGGPEISLLDLATHYSGLPRVAGNIRADRDPDTDYNPEDLFHYIGRHGVRKSTAPSFQYSNLGFALLGQALANRAGVSYADLLRSQVTGPLGLRDTTLRLDSEQRARLLPGHAAEGQPVTEWEFDAQAPAGGIVSTAADLLTYLEAQLHPERSPSALAAAIRETQVLHANLPLPIEAGSRARIGLAWMHATRSGTYSHGGNGRGHTSFAFFNPAGDYAAVVLVNTAADLTDFRQALADHVRQRLTGEPATALSPLFVPSNQSALSLPRALAAYWITMLSGAAFIFGCVLGVQGLAAQLLPRRLLLRVSSFLQMAALCAFLGGYFLQPMLAGPQALTDAQGSGLLSWSPSYWFLGLFQQLNGTPVFPRLAHRAWLGLAIVGVGTTVVYALSYLRTLRRIVEEPDILPGVRSATWLPPFGTPRQTALAHFSIRTLLRSRNHRVLLAFYLGLGLAITILLLNTRSTQEVMSTIRNPWRQVNLPMLSSSIVMLCAWIMGTRIVFAMPFDLRANWIFRVTPIHEGRELTSARRRALLAVSVAPVWVGAAAVFLTLWPWPPAIGHLLVLVMLGAILAELSLAGAQKIPFTCSYLPGKSQVHLKFWFCLAVLLQLLNRASELVRGALQSFTTYFILAAILGAIAIAARHWTAASLENELIFEDAEEPAVQRLGLYRDGFLPIESPPA